MPLAAAVLKNGLEAVQKGKAIGAKTEREGDWLAAIELYYKDYDKVDQTTRGLAYEKAMERLMQKYPDDPEAAIFYALALNETALHSDKTYANQLKAGAILEKIAATQPEHPGVLHYLIHTYDYTPLAQRALDAANKYADVAPAAPHAQHMPSHTYSMLGLWPQSVESNVKSRARAQEQAARLWPGAAHSRRATHIGFHGIRSPADGQGASARSSCVTRATQSRNSDSNLWAATPGSPQSQHASRSNAKHGMKPATLEPRGSQFPQAEAITYFARALGSARSGDLAAAQQGRRQAQRTARRAGKGESVLLG